MNCLPTYRRFFFIPLACVVLLGCQSRSDDGLTSAAGNVRLNGKPLDSGTIEFKHTNGVTPPVIAKIEHGNFATRLPTGTMKILISSSIKVGEKQAYQGEANSPVMDIVKKTIPAKYNTKSQLTLEVGDKPLEGLQYDLQK